MHRGELSSDLRLLGMGVGTRKPQVQSNRGNACFQAVEAECCEDGPISWVTPRGTHPLTMIQSNLKGFCCCLHDLRFSL